MTRIVSLIPSATEIVAALGFEGDLVGRSHECDYPLAVRKLPPLTAPKFDLNGDSRQIDERVKTVLKDALSVYRVDEVKLNDLKPDIIVTQAQCEVCAVSLNEVERVARECLDTPAQIVSLEPMQISDLFDDICRVAEALCVPERGLELTFRLRERMDDIKRRAAATATMPRVTSIEWIDPMMAGGNWIPELVELAGGIELFGKAGQHSPWLEWNDLAAADPDVIVILPCGFGIERARQEMPALTSRPGWKSLRAVRNGQVYLTDGNQYFNRPGPRLVESLEILAEILHPEAFRFGHEGRGWLKFQS
ncbi:MAG: ABC transporter substrate-binding protein [Chloroflexi bacterium]|nr:ABC transporter substrate-binding protein [Chloroflexota bacterium]